jgi:hypothetical protein
MSDRQSDLSRLFSKNEETLVDKEETLPCTTPPVESPEKKLLVLLKKGLTPEKARQKLQWSRSYIYKVLKKLKENGEWTNSGQKVTSHESLLAALPGSGQKYRIHGFVLTIPVRHKTEGYLRRMRKQNIRFFDPGHRVVLGVKYVRVEGARDFGFFGVDHSDAHAQALDYWERFVVMLENRLDTVLIKNGTGFELFYHEAETKNELAAELNSRKERIVVRAEDGKVWLITDNSFKLDEMETVHAHTAGEDMNHVVAPVMNNYREYSHHLRLPTESWAMHDRLASLVLEMADIQRSSEERIVAALSVVAEQQKRSVAEAERLNGELARRLAEMNGATGEMESSSVLRGYTG